MRKGGVKMKWSKCRGIEHNTKTCPQNRREAINHKGESISARQYGMSYY
jgi:hypothetical protein